MLHEIGVDLGVKLAARGFPLKAFPIVDGPEPSKTTTFERERIVIEEGAGDAFVAVLSQRHNPAQAFNHVVGAKLTIYARAARVGSTYWEHRRRATHVLDMVVVALREIFSERKNGFTLGAGRFVRPEDLERSEAPGGAAYELLFTFTRGVPVLTWAGDARPEATIGPGGVSIASTDEITDPTHPTPETAC